MAAIFPPLMPTSRTASSLDSGSITRPCLKTMSYCCAVKSAGKRIHANRILPPQIEFWLKGSQERDQRFAFFFLQAQAEFVAFDRACLNAHRTPTPRPMGVAQAIRIEQF